MINRKSGCTDPKGSGAPRIKTTIKSTIATSMTPATRLRKYNRESAKEESWGLFVSDDSNDTSDKLYLPPSWLNYACAPGAAFWKQPYIYSTRRNDLWSRSTIPSWWITASRGLHGRALKLRSDSTARLFPESAVSACSYCLRAASFRPSLR